MALTKSDRLWIRKMVRREMQDSEDRVKAHLTDVLTEEARLAVLHAMTVNQSPNPPAKRRLVSLGYIWK